MNQGKYIFAQLTDFLPRRVFDRFVETHNGNKYVKSFTCWNQMLCMVFGQLTSRDSMCDLMLSLEAHKPKFYHLGFDQTFYRRNLGIANEKRSYKIFEEFAYVLIEEALRSCYRDDFEVKVDGNVYALDSTTIDLCLSVFWWAEFRKHKGGIKIHTHGSFFVTRAKDNMRFKRMYSRKVDKNAGVLSDQIGKLETYQSSKHYPEKLRRIKYYDEITKMELIFITNNTALEATEIALLYKKRWQVEQFFKWMKQHLKIKSFWGTSINAVKIQMYSAIIAYCLVAIIGNKLKVDRKIYEILQILSISLLDKTPINEVLAKCDYKDVKELDYKQLIISGF